MDVVVCVKRTPDTTTRIKVAADGRDIDPQGVEWVINPYDEFAIEEALKLRDASGGGAVTAVSVDPEANQTVMRKALAMGVDQGLILQGGGNYDGFSTASALAEALKGIRFDLALFGKQAIDDDGYQVPSMVAHLLGLPRVNVVTKLEVANGRAVARRQIEGGDEVVDLPLPCVISCQRGLNEPRYPSLKGIMAAKKKPLEVRKVEAPAPALVVEKIEPPPPRPPGRIVADVRGKSKEEIRAACGELMRLLKEEAKVL
jgi:electron transfer flavoprotein beta subunit